MTLKQWQRPDARPDLTARLATKPEFLFCANAVTHTHDGVGCDKQFWYPDVRVFPQGPLVHYIHYGWREGRDPSAGFSTEGYLRANPDVRESGCNPLVHFVESGLSEGRQGWQKNPDAPPPKPHPLDYHSGKLLPPPNRAPGA